MIRGLKQIEEEINIIMDIWLEAAIAGHPFIRDSYWRSQYNVVRDYYLPGSQTYVYEEKGRIQGFISLIDQKYIGALFVAGNARGKGIGSQLIHFACNKHSDLELGVFAENKRALAFYERHGFHVYSSDSDTDTGEKRYMMKRGF
ncbi:N-acetyltransferase [Bacillus sp. 1P06AnD]|uniref:N-acetyltransferase n=1 Tax=Bacillus sp. 1P06AnD TaxID=3132208 RepID=UPI0039A1FB51